MTPALQTRRELQAILIKKLYHPSHLYGLVYRSYEDFIERSIDQTLAEFSGRPVYRIRKNNEWTTYALHYGKSRILRKKVTERQKKETQLGKVIRQASSYLMLQVPISLVRTTKDQETVIVPAKTYRICDIPLLHNSKYDSSSEATQDRYPYFLINGNARILTNQMVHKGFVPKVSMRKQGDRIVSLSYSIVRKRNTEEYQYKEGTMKFVRNQLRVDFFKILRVLGIPLQEIMGLAPAEQSLTLLAMVQDAYAIRTEEQARKQIEQSLRITDEPFEVSLLAALGYPRAQDARLALMDRLQAILEALRGAQGRLYMDHVGMKRVLTCGATLARAFAEGVEQFQTKIKTPLISSLESVIRNKSLVHLVRPEVITRVLKKLILTRTSQDEEPLNRPLSLLNDLQSIADLRKVVTSLNKNLAHESYRQFNPSEVGRICPVHTPHSRSTGLVESLAIGCRVTTPFTKTQQAQLETILEDLRLSKLRSPAFTTRVFLNDQMIGYADLTAEELANAVKLKRKTLPLGVSYQEGRLHLASAPGRMLKLMLCIQKGRIPFYKLKPDALEALTIQKLEQKGLIRYVDADQQQSTRVAVDVDEYQGHEYYYPGGMLSYGYTMGYIPAANNNTGARASLTLRFVGQALSEEKPEDYPSMSSVEQRLVRTEPSLVQTPCETSFSQSIGANILTAIASYKDYTCEDAVVLNKQAVERGMMDYLMIKREKVRFLPDERGEYLVLNAQGEPTTLPRLGTRREKSQPLIRVPGATAKRTRTEMVSLGPDYALESIHLAKVKKDCKATFSFREYRGMTVGQKIASRQGQKGVVGGIVSECNLPFSYGGHAPGLLVSPNVFNSRMTIGPLSQMMLGKVAALRMKPSLVEVIQDDCLRLIGQARSVLREEGLDQRGCEPCLQYGCHNRFFYLGFLKIFLLEHHSKDKVHRRRRGAIDILTRQPLGGGKKSNGGLRFGEMQRDAALAHGTPHLLNERLTPDTTQISVCQTCHTLVNDDHRYEGSEVCSGCNGPDLVRVTVPYAFLVLLRTLRGASIETCIVPDSGRAEGRGIDDTSETVEALCQGPDDE